MRLGTIVTLSLFRGPILTAVGNRYTSSRQFSGRNFSGRDCCPAKPRACYTRADFQVSREDSPSFE